MADDTPTTLDDFRVMAGVGRVKPALAQSATKGAEATNAGARPRGRTCS